MGRAFKGRTRESLDDGGGQGMGVEMDFLGSNPHYSFTDCVTLGKSLNFSLPHFLPITIFFLPILLLSFKDVVDLK